MPETIDFQLALGIAASLVSIIGILGAALLHAHTQSIKRDIKNLDDKIPPLVDSVNSAHDRITDHVEDYHTVKS